MAIVAGACYGQPLYVPAGNPRPLAYGLLSISDIREGGVGHWQQGVEWEPAVCGPAGVYACPTCAQNNSSEVQSLTEGGAGLTSFTLTFRGSTTGAIAAAAIGSTVQTALEALPTIGVGNVTVSGGAGGPYTVTFTGTLSNSDVPLLTATPTGGTGTVTPALVTQGGNTAPAKTYTDGPGSTFAAPFTVYGSFDCSPIGNWDRAEERARELLKHGGERAVELAIANGASHTSQALQDATSVNVTPTPGTPVTIAQGLAILESYIGANGSGEGAIIANRREVFLANEHGKLVAPNGSELATVLGTPVAAVAGWNGLTGPNNLAAGAGEAWLFALGSRPRVWRSETFLVSDREHSLDKAFNNLRILAEQTYVIGWDCFAAGVLVYNGTDTDASAGLPVEV